MPKWIHDRARHIQAKNPEMPESRAFAIATQQAHKLNKTPKGFGTAEGKKKAKAKYRESRKSYTQSADPKGLGKKYEQDKLAFDLHKIDAFADELQKIGSVLMKRANMPPMVQPSAPPQVTAGVSEVKSKSPKKGGVLASSTPTYSKVHSVPTPSPAAGSQPIAGAPPVRS